MLSPSGEVVWTVFVATLALEIFCCELPVREKNGVCPGAPSERRLTLSLVKSSLRHSSKRVRLTKLFSFS